MKRASMGFGRREICIRRVRLVEWRSSSSLLFAINGEDEWTEMSIRHPVHLPHHGWRANGEFRNAECGRNEGDHGRKPEKGVRATKDSGEETREDFLQQTV